MLNKKPPFYSAKDVLGVEKEYKKENGKLLYVQPTGKD
jgi:hypothetical protein